MNCLASPAPADALLISDLHAWRGTAHVLKGVHLRAARGQAIALVGPPGAGCTTLLQAIMGLTGTRHGSVRIHDTESIHLPHQDIGLMGVSYCADNYSLAPDLSCEDNLLLATASQSSLGGACSLAELYELLPFLQAARHRQVSDLSEGERRLLSVARLLRTGANLLLLDGVAAGLQPIMRHMLAHLILILKRRGYTLLITEKDHAFIAPLADRFHVLQGGRILPGLNSAQFLGEPIAAPKVD